MKTMKWMITVGLLATCFGLSAQKLSKEEKAQAYTDAAVKEFGLNDDQKVSVYDLQLEANMATSAIWKDAKAGIITPEEKKVKMKELWTKTKGSMMEITGKTKKEIGTFQSNYKKAGKKE